MLIQRALPLSISYILLILATIALDFILHSATLVWVGRYLGIAGTLFVILSFAYSARKKKLLMTGPHKLFLKLHCNAGWIGTLMILVHSGIHFNALLPWTATAFMMIVTGSGHVGQYLLKKVREEVKMKQSALDAEEENENMADLYWDSMTVKALEQWRGVHMPMVSVLIALSLTHIFTILALWNWR
ncbi:MAG: hypothetical protein WCH05_08930 [Chlorobiaceae bacterium]